MSQRGVEPNAIGSMVPPFGGSSGGGGGGGVSVASPLLWNANGMLSGFNVQGANFNGLLSSNALLAGDGPFDGMRVVAAAATVLNLHVIQRVPNTLVPATNTQVQFYRIRGGTVTSLGVVSLAAAANFAAGSTAPASATLLVGDILFVTFAAQSTDPTGADLTAYLELS